MLLTLITPFCNFPIFAIQKLGISFIYDSLPVTRFGPTNVGNDKPSSISIASSLRPIDKEVSTVLIFPETEPYKSHYSIVIQNIHNWREHLNRYWTVYERSVNKFDSTNLLIENTLKVPALCMSLQPCFQNSAVVKPV